MTTSAGDVHVVELKSDNANAIDENVLVTISDALKKAIDENKSAVVLTGYDQFFSAGLNLKGLPDDEAGMASFIDRFEAVNLELLEFPLPIVAAVNGHAIAGGCVLACTADVRIGAEGNYKLGVSEVSLGIVFPSSAFEIMRASIAAPAVPNVLLGGKLLSPEEAVTAGILHRVVPKAELRQQAIEQAQMLAKGPRTAFHHTKLALRAPLLERIERTREASRRGFLETWFSPEVVARRRALLQ